MASIFTRIIQGEIPSYKIAEDEHFIAILDAFPNTRGHTLCIPKKEINKFYEMEAEAFAGLMKFSQKIAVALEKAVQCKRVGMAVIGLEVSHVHVHLIPLNHMSEMDFTQQKKVFSNEEFEEVANQIKLHLT